MSLEEDRRRHEELQRHRAVMAMRPVVARAVGAKARDAGLVDDAVGEAITQMVASREHLGEPAEVRERWILYATRRLIDVQDSAEYRRRDPVPLDEHALALTASVSGDLGRATEQDRAEWRTREQLGELEGEDSAWAETWFDLLLAKALKPGAQPRGVAEEHGWDLATTKDVSFRARRKMAAFALNHASGVICVQRRALLDHFIAANRDRELPDALDEKGYKQVLFHIAGCDSCRAEYDTRRRRRPGRAPAFLPLPLSFGWLTDVARALREKLTGVGGSVHGVTYSVRHRLGLGGGTGAIAAGGGAASIGGKVVAGCTALACAAAAGTTAFVNAVPVVLPGAPHHGAHRAAAQRKPPTPATASASALQRARPASARPVTPSAAVTAHAAVAPRRPARRAIPTFTPGDLQTASSPAAPPPVAQTATVASTAPAATRAVSPPAAASPSQQPTCTPGDLKC